MKSETLIARQRRVLPLSEFRVGFTVEYAGLQDAERGATDVDYADLDRADLDRATYEAALIENRAVFHGWPDTGITGIAESSAHSPVSLGKGADAYPHAVARAVETLRHAGIAGPYALAIGPEGYQRIAETTERGGYTLSITGLPSLGLSRAQQTGAGLRSSNADRGVPRNRVGRASGLRQ